MATSKAPMDQGEDSLPRVLWENSESKPQSRKKTPPIVENTAAVAKELPTPSPAKEQLTPTKQSNQPERQSELFASNTAAFSLVLFHGKQGTSPRKAGCFPVKTGNKFSNEKGTEQLFQWKGLSL